MAVQDEEEDAEGAWLLGEGQEGPAPLQCRVTTSALWLRLALLAALCLLAVGGVVALTVQGSSEQPSRFRHELLRKYEKLDHESQESHESHYDVGPASLLWQCVSGSVPAACNTSFASTFVTLLLAALLCLCLGALNFYANQAPQELSQVSEELRLMRHLVFLAHEMKSGESDAECKQKMQRSWDATAIGDNLHLVDELARIMKRYPSFRFRLKGISYGSGEVSQRTESAFYHDFHEDFPKERMDWVQPYAHARALSLKRLLVRRGIHQDRLQTMVQGGEANTVVVEAFR
ncbi:unnamed protein product [Symbiodinium natans]|uniref:Uncharacterized protein n=1 Tax=Symbiodinium natans TaxID=878477 RepID=A0A812PAK8_9DINO|nr:unnamed protein product [Symbiodinium natans]